MKKFAFLLSLAVIAGCNSDDDSTFLPDPAVPQEPAPGELPVSVTVMQLNLKDEVCEGVSPLDRNGVLTHSWTAITDYSFSSDEVMVQGDLLAIWDNNTESGGFEIICHSETVFPNVTETYDLSSATSGMNVIITTDPDYFQPEFAED